MTRLADWLGIQPGEGRSASLMLAHSFFMGLSTVFFETAASALFLASYGAGWLPWVYVAAAVLNTVTGVAYTSIRQSVSFRTLMGGTLVFLLVCVTAFRGAMALSSEAWLAFALLVFYRVLSILTDLEYWAVAARLYNVRQAKRLFGLIGSGEVVARILGAFAVPVLMKVFGGVEDLVLLSAVALAGCLAVVLPVLRVISAEQDEASRSTVVKAEPKRSAWQHLRVLLENRYLALILGLAALGVLGKYFVDFAFLAQMKVQFGSGKPKELAGFFGLFSGVTQAVSLLTRMLLSGRILNRYGIGTGLLILPIAHTVCTALILVMGNAAGAMAVFWLAVTNQGIYKVLKHPIDNPSFKVLYQPLKREQRLSAQIAVEAIVTPVCIGVAGVLMLLFTNVIPYNAAYFAWVMLAAFAGWVVVARKASAEYRGALMRALRSRLVDHEALSLSDQPSLQLVRDKLNSSSPGDVIFALDLLERFDQPDLPTLLAARLLHPSPDVRRYALQRIEAIRPPRALDAVRTSVMLERDPGVKAIALRCLAALGDDTMDGQVAAFLDDPDLRLRRGALAGLLRDEAGPAAHGARRSLQALATSADPEQREAAARVIGEVGGAALADVLLPLLRDEHPEVRRAALGASSRVTLPGVWLEVMDSLSSPTFCNAAAAALTATGPVVLGAVGERMKAERTRLGLYRLAYLCGRIGGPAAVAPLLQHVSHENTLVRLQVLESLARVGWKPSGDDAGHVRAVLREEARQTAWRSACLVALTSGDERVRPVRLALESEQDEARRRVLALLSFVADRDTVLRAAENLTHEHKDKRAYAMELLDLAVPRDLRELVLPVVEDLPPETRIERLEEHAPGLGLTRDEVIRQIIVHPVYWLRPWTRACALWSARRLGLQMDAVLPEAAEDDRLVAETLAWAQGTWEGADHMLTVEKVMILKGVQMFSRTPEEVLEDLAAILEEVDLKKDAFIFRKGDPGDSMYIIIDGSVRVVDGDRTINVLGDRDIFGELALLDPEPRSASVQAVEDTRLFRIDRETFSELMAGSISIVRGVLHVLCERLRRLIPMAQTAAAQTEAARQASAAAAVTSRE